ncbi:MAG: hypothetical protein EBR02_06540 [Alphaproteobacteria bacterium]|nr:hypothetical protein [Alphaproteobacteria bacterium]
MIAIRPFTPLITNHNVDIENNSVTLVMSNISEEVIQSIVDAISNQRQSLKQAKFDTTITTTIEKDKNILEITFQDQSIMHLACAVGTFMANQIKQTEFPGNNVLYASTKTIREVLSKIAEHPKIRNIPLNKIKMDKLMAGTMEMSHFSM